MYDVIVIGARVAGSPTAMLLARRGYRVLLLDRASFPSDTLSTHQIQLRGGAMLNRWGLFERILATNCPPARQASFHQGPLTLSGKYPPLDGIEAVVSPRRTILDKILADAAVESGVELRQDFLVDELIFEGGRVSGVRGHSKSGATDHAAALIERARLIIGADGKHSLVAKAVQAPEYNLKPALTCAYYTYWEGIDLQGGEMYSLADAVVGIWPTNDRLAIIYTAYPIAEFQAVREDIEGRFWRTMETLPGLAERLHSGRQAERFYGTADVPGFYRNASGPGWALVGDAGMTLDPITGQGIGNAFQDAEHLADAVDAGFKGQMPLEGALAEYEKMRNEDTLPMYEFTGQLASFTPPTVEQQVLFAALARKPEEAGQFFGLLTGSVPFQKFFAPSNLFRLMGIAGMGQVIFSKITQGRRKQARQFA